MRGLVGICIFFLLLGPVAGAKAQQRLVLSTIEGTPNGVIGAAVLKAAYGKLGIELEFYYTSGKRSLLVAASGVVDGEAVRVGSVSETHPSLLRIDVPIYKLDISAFAKRLNVPERGVEDLPYLRVGYLQGAIMPEDIVRDFSDVWQAHSNRELFELLMADKLDAVITSTITRAVTARQLGIDDAAIAGQPILQEHLYHFLHQKHADLVPVITAVLEEMAESREVDAIVTASTKDLLSRGYPERAPKMQ